MAAMAAAHYATFCEKWAAEKTFLAYFKSEWGDKLGEKSILLVISFEFIASSVLCDFSRISNVL